MNEPNLRDWKFWATSPYMWTSLLPTLALAIAGISMGVGIYAGMRHGRAEMKRWQDDWYAAHPVVKERAWWEGLPSGDYACKGPTDCVQLKVEPAPVYIPERNDYACPDGWTPAGGWGKNGVPLNPYRPIGCKRMPAEKP